MRTTDWLTALCVIGIVLVGMVGLTSAHDTKTVNGYELTFGGSDEPVITGERMWLEVRIVDVEADEPVADLEDDLEMAVQRPFGDDTNELEVSGRFGAPGWYEAAIIFTKPGTYTVFLNGTVDGTPIDTTFQTQVHNASNLHYPTGPASSQPSSGLDASTGFAVGAVVAAVGMLVAFAVGRRVER